ncbi:MAG: hypothetical protein M5U34_26670 [Chloroflexi bacterium]|nr:hypothetical protein [Chloroflexota bacterium]
MAAITAIRIGAFDMAVGNLFGSSVLTCWRWAFLTFSISTALSWPTIDPAFAMVGLIGILLMNMALIGNLARVERKFFVY